MGEINISIIVPIYNVCEYIAQCMESILKQENVTMQVICINDKTADNSMDIVASYKNKIKNLDIYENEYNMGLSSTRNVGISHAIGEYLFFLDSDDYLEDNCLSKLYEYAKENALDALTYDSVKFSGDEYMKEYNPDSYVRKNKYKIEKGERLLELFLDNNDLIRTACGTMYKTEFIKKNNILFMDHIYHEDIPYTFEATMKAERAGCLNITVYHYRQRYGSITKVPRYDRLIKGLMAGYDKIYKLSSLFEKESSKTVAQRYLSPIRTMMVNYLVEYASLGMTYDKDIENFVRQHSILQDVNIEEYIGSEAWNKMCKINKASLYGAGWVCKRLYWVLKKQIEFDKIYVSNMQDNPKELFGLRVCQWEGTAENDIPVIVALSNKNKEQIVERFRQDNFYNYILLDFEC